MPGEIVRDIAAKMRIIYDTAGFQQFAKDILDNVQKMRGLAVAYQAVAKAQQDINTKQLAAESKQLTIENKKLALESKQLTIENKKSAQAGKELVNRNRELAAGLKEVRLAQQKARGERYAEELKKQDKAAKGLTSTLGGVKDSLIALGVTAAARGLLNIGLKTERTVLRIKNLVDQTALKGLEARFAVLNKQSDDLFSPTDFEQSAAAVFKIDRNTRRFARSLEFATKMSPVLGKSLKEIQEGIAKGVIFGDEESLIELGLITPLALEEMRRRTGLSLSDLRVSERENFIFSRLKLSKKQLDLSDKAAKGLNATWDRFTKFIERGARTLSNDFKPVVIFLLKSMTGIMRMLASSPVGIFVLRLGGLIAGLATLVLGLGALTKALIFLRGVTLALNAATLLLMAKYLFWGALILGVILLLDELWVTVTGGAKADTLIGDLVKKIKEFFKDIGLDDFINDFDNWLNNIFDKVAKLLNDILIKVKDFFQNRLMKEVNNFFDAIGFTSLTKKIDIFLESTVEKFAKRFQTIEKILTDVGIGKPGSSLFEFLPELGGDFNLNQTPPQRQLIAPAPEPVPQVDSSTSIRFGANTFNVQGGLGKQQIINIAVEEYRRELQKEFTEANIGAQ